MNLGYNEHMQWIKRHSVFVSVVLFLITLNVLFYFVGAEQIVAYIGIHNTYLVVFAVAAIGGLSTVTGTVLYTSIATFAAGGSSPFLLGIAGGIGIMISDSIFFYLAKRGRESVPEKWNGWISKLEGYVQKYPRWIVLLGVYLYLAFSPLPNDILMVALVMTGFRYREIIIPLIPGSITIALITAYFGNLWF